MVAELSLDKQLLQDVTREICKPRAAAVRSAEGVQTLADSRAPRVPLLGQRRGTQRHTPILPGDQDALTQARLLKAASIQRVERAWFEVKQGSVISRVEAIGHSRSATNRAGLRPERDGICPTGTRRIRDRSERNCRITGTLFAQ